MSHIVCYCQNCGGAFDKTAARDLHQTFCVLNSVEIPEKDLNIVSNQLKTIIEKINSLESSFAEKILQAEKKILVLGYISNIFLFLLILFSYMIIKHYQK